MTRLVKAVDKFVSDNQDKRMVAFAVLLDENSKENADRVAAFSKQHSVSFPLTIALEGSKGPGAYSINEKAAITVLATKRNTVEARFALTDPAPEEEAAQAKEVEDILAAGNKLLQ